MTDIVRIEGFLQAEGFDTPEAREPAREVLEQGRFTRPGKQAMAGSKLPAARMLLTSRLRKLCPTDADVSTGRWADHTGQMVVLVTGPSCEVCGGSNNRRAAQRLTERLRILGVERMLVVGGTSAQHAELDQLLGSEGLHLRYVDGAVGSHSKRDSEPDLRWAQVMVIWGATPLPHKVSYLYTDAPPDHVRVVKLGRRGIEALCEEVLRSFG